MKKLLLLLCASVIALVSCHQSAPESSREMVLWYDQPAGEVWLDGLFIGNGYMGGNVFGRIEHERIALNESTFWSGRPVDYNDPEAHNYFEQIKALMYAKKYKEAERLVDAHFYGKPANQQTYVPVGDLLLDFPAGKEAVTDYYRELDMETGIVKVCYTQDGVQMTREVFMSYPDHVMVMRVSADQPGAVNVEATLQSPFRRQIAAADNRLTMKGTWSYLPTRIFDLIAKVEGDGMSFQTDVVALPEKGTLEATDSSLVVKGADAVTFVLTIATDYVNYKDISGDPSARCEAVLSAVDGKKYKALRETHVKDFSGLMGRVHLNVGDGLKNGLPTQERVAALKRGEADADLQAKLYQFGRYITFSGSREGSEPSNLQGRWSQDLLPNWGSKYTLNVNTEMNYWPTEVTNLSECTAPLFHLIEDLAENGAETAKLYYGADGWVSHHNTDLWRGTAPVDAARYGMWPMSGAWLCQHIWEHYLFTEDIDFLKKYYPLMKGAAEFVLDILAENPNYGYLTIPFSMSPEQGYFIEGNPEEQFLAPSTTMDNALIRDLFPHCIEAAKLLDVDADFCEQLAATLARIPPYMIGANGMLQGWIEDWERGRENHNWSGTFGLYPGNSITLRGTPELAAAVEAWLEPRPVISFWNSAIDICQWARLENGEKVDEVLRKIFMTPEGRRMMMGGFGNNLHFSGSNQSDINFGITAGIAESLLQSHAGEISILPALPASWKEGSVSGLKARGDYEVSINWADGKMLSCTIKSNLGKPFTVRYAGKTREIQLPAGKSIQLGPELQ
ncbi:MAG: glycoside hydrolase family 95 protein [Bacteroidales bacterium]|nr:glycoside hydrolase family 95 protein [Bacteroidales bacterium]